MSWMVIFGIAAFAVIGLALLVYVPKWMHPRLSTGDLRKVSSPEVRIQLQQAQSKLQNDARSALLQGLAGLVVVVGGVAAWRQVQVSRDAQNVSRAGQTVELFSRAIDQIGNSDNVDVRIGGIYALERIAKNSPDDRNMIQVIIGNYVRGHAPWPVGSPDSSEHPTATVDRSRPWLRVFAPDIQTAVAILARRPSAVDAPRLYLSRVDLRSLFCENRQLTFTSFRHSNLARAWLRGTRLDGSDFTDADLRQANLENARLEGATLVGTHLSGARLRGANLRGANLRGADLRGADMRAMHVEQAELADACADETTIWPDNLDVERLNALGVQTII